MAGARALAGALGKSPLSGASPGTARWCAGEAPRTSPVSVLMISALNLSVDTDADADDGMDWDADDDARTPMTPAGHSVFAFDRAAARADATTPIVTADATTPIADRRHPTAFARSPPPSPARPTLGASRSYDPAEFPQSARARDDFDGRAPSPSPPPPRHRPRTRRPFARSPVRTVAEVAETSSDMFTLSDADELDDDDAPFIARRRASDASASSDENFDEHLDEDFPTTGTSPSRSTLAARAMDFERGGFLGAGLTVSVPRRDDAFDASPPAAPGKSSSARRLRRMGSLAETKLLAQAGLARTSSINLGRGASGGEDASFRFHDHFFFLRPIGRGARARRGWSRANSAVSGTA